MSVDVVSGRGHGQGHDGAALVVGVAVLSLESDKRLSNYSNAFALRVGFWNRPNDSRQIYSLRAPLLY